MAKETGWEPDFIRWKLPLAEMLRYRHASLWLSGWTVRRAGRWAKGQAQKRRARFEAAAARYVLEK